MSKPLGQPEPSRKVVDLTVYLKDGHLVNPDEGGERHVIGTAEIVETRVAMTLADVLPDGVMDAIAGTAGPVKMSLGFDPPITIPPLMREQPHLWDWHKQQ